MTRMLQHRGFGVTLKTPVTDHSQKPVSVAGLSMFGGAPDDHV